jgi:hypothetical protein
MVATIACTAAAAFVVSVATLGKQKLARMAAE